MTEPFTLTRPKGPTWGSAQTCFRDCRHEIRRWWVSNPQRWVAWLMLNPAKADAEHNDLTVLRVNDFSRAWGYDGWIGVNCYPYVTADPRVLWATKVALECGHGHYMPELAWNLRCIEAAAREATLRMVAFGSEIAKRNESWLEQCFERFSQPHNGPLDPDCVLAPGRSELYCLGTSKSGYPLHPLARGRKRVPSDQTPIPWSRPCIHS